MKINPMKESNIEKAERGFGFYLSKLPVAFFFVTFGSEVRISRSRGKRVIRRSVTIFT